MDQKAYPFLVDTQNSTQTDRIQSPPTSDFNWAGYLMRATLWFFAALLLYLLAIGPAIRMSDVLPATRPFVYYAYRPVDVLGSACPSFAKAMTWYIRCWHSY